ncbi:MAG: oligosaccharide flippase family protein [Hyphomicrobiales bacterium]|nr:oligosaccharide flippase family protein [Hyphomicrobiales bacterium]
MPYPGLRSIARNTAFLTVARAVNVGTRTVYVILVARLLGPELYAMLAYSQAWYLAFMPIAIFGLGGVMVRSIGLDRTQAPEIAARALTVRLLSTTVAAIACVVLGWVLARDPQTPVLISVLVFALVARGVTQWAQHLFTAFEVSHHSMRQELVFRVTEVSIAIAVLLAGGDIIFLVATHAAVWWVQAIRALLIVHRRLVPLRVAWSPSRWLPMVVQAFPFFMGLLGMGWQNQAPVVMFRNLSADDVLVGQFALAMQALFISAALPEALAAAALPVLARSAQRADGKDLTYARGLLRLSFLLGAGAGLCGMAFGPWLFPVLFGPRFETAGHLVGLTLWCLIPMMARTALPAVIVARGHFYVAMFGSLAGAAAVTVLMPVLVDALGAPGAVLAAGLAMTVPAVVTIAFAVAKGWITIYAVLVRPVGAVAAGLAAYLFLQPLSPWLALAVALVAMGLASIALQVITKEERGGLRALYAEYRANRGRRNGGGGDAGDGGLDGG